MSDGMDELREKWKKEEEEREKIIRNIAKFAENLPDEETRKQVLRDLDRLNKTLEMLLKLQEAPEEYEVAVSFSLEGFCFDMAFNVSPKDFEWKIKEVIGKLRRLDAKPLPRIYIDKSAMEFK